MTDSVPFERRLGDRRQNDRRVASRSTAEESWFGALGVGGDTEIQGEASAVSPAATDAAIGRDGPASAVSDDETRRSEGREARRVASSPEAALRRVFRTYVAARALLGLLLAAVPWIASLSGGRSALPLIALCMAYGVQSVLFWLWPHMREGDEVLPVSSLRRRHWIATIGVDLCVFAALHLFDPLANLNFGALLVLPVLMAGVMAPRPAALATAAAVALVLLAGVWRGAGQPGDVALTLTQAGLAGIGIFMIALLAGELSGRLAREERAARGSLELARQQAQLNRLVIEEMTDGVLVVDRRARVRAANPAARALLAPDGLTKPAPFQLQGEPAWSALSTAVEQAFAAGEWPESARLIRLQFANDRSRTVQLRARFTRRRNGESGQDAQEEFCVVFLDDLRNVQARVQKEKLAAMGRVSAGIAHEIRNPLAAIAQANALLLEDALPADQHRLARMVADNVERLKRIVDDVMAVAPGAATENRVIDATAQVDAVSAEWSRTVQTPSGPGGRLRVELPDGPIGVRFDGEHLRRVLTNLLDNARRHASDAAGAIELRLEVNNEQKATLAVASDGEPIRPDVERFLFEPFFSTRSRGTGLGLYICRELCARYGATIEYRPHGGDHRHHNEFVITMQREVLPVRNATTP